MAHNLVQRRRGWYAQLNVPADVQALIGRAKFRESLETRDRDKAIIMAGPKVSGWRQQIADARDQLDTKMRVGWVEQSRRTRAEKRKAMVGKPRPEPPEEDEATRIRRLQIAMRDAKTPEEKEGVDIEIGNLISDAEMIHRDYAQENQKTGDIPEVRELVGKIYAKPTLDYIDGWITQLKEDGLKPKTIHMRRSTVTKLAETFPTLASINRKDVRKWTRDLRATGLAPADPENGQRRAHLVPVAG